MTRSSVREYVEAVCALYGRAGRQEKGRILDEFTQVTGYHRKAAVRLLRRAPGAPTARRGCRRFHGPEVAAALRTAWEATDRLCSRRLHPFLSELVPVLEQQGHLVVDHARRLVFQLADVAVPRALLAKCCQNMAMLTSTRDWQ